MKHLVIAWLALMVFAACSVRDMNGSFEGVHWVGLCQGVDARGEHRERRLLLPDNHNAADNTQCDEPGDKADK